MIDPKISVIMAVYNTEAYLADAIESILSQSFKELEFIIIDDCSTDGSYKICEKYANRDERIVLYKNKENEGISATRNKLILKTKTNYIATQDSDDISMYDRLKLSYNFLETHKNFAVVSGDNIIIDIKGQRIGIRKYADCIGKMILKKSPVSNPSSMFRKDIFFGVGGYDAHLNYGEDYDLWCRIYAKGYGLKNLSENLLCYRIREGQTKESHVKATLINTLSIQKRAIKEYGIVPGLSDKLYHSLEAIVLLLPEKIILSLFKKLEYKNAK